MFSVLINSPPRIPFAQIREGINKLCQKYPDDLADDSTEEFQQFQNAFLILKQHRGYIYVSWYQITVGNDHSLF